MTRARKEARGPRDDGNDGNDGNEGEKGNAESDIPTDRV
jgi:hypothetical protein